MLAETGVGDKETKGADGGDGEAGGTNVREKRRKKRGKRKMISTLSFGEEIAEDEDGERGDASGTVTVTGMFRFGVGCCYSQRTVYLSVQCLK